MSVRLRGRFTRFIVCGVVVCLLGCAKISDFNEPYVQELFMGSLAITPSLRGLTASGRATGVVTIVGNETGETVTIYGLPQNEPFEIIPNTNPLEPPITVAGLEAEVIDKRTLEIIGFSSQSDAALELELQVTGTLIRQGPRIATMPGKPIVVKGRAGPVKEALPAIILDKIRTIVGDRPIDEVPDGEMVPLYQINFVGQITSPL